MNDILDAFIEEYKKTLLTETINVKYFADIDPLEFVGGQGHSAWIDLRCAEDIEMKAGEFKLIPLGVAMKLPDGYEAQVAPRSSTFKKHGILLANSLGIIDPKYCGPKDQWFFPAYAVRDTKIEKNTRIAQFRIQKCQPLIRFNTVEELEGESRGGIGSTGQK